MHLLIKQASRPLHVHTTMLPPSLITVYHCTRLNPICEIKNQKKKSGIGHQIFIIIIHYYENLFLCNCVAIKTGDVFSYY
jgi:hypothetical protein